MPGSTKRLAYTAVLVLVTLLPHLASALPAAKNIILFIGDGMQREHELAASRYLTGTDTGLTWQSFPYRTDVATWDVTTYNRYAFQRYSTLVTAKGSSWYDSTRIEPLLGYDPAKGGVRTFRLDTSGLKEYFLTRLTSPFEASKDVSRAKVPATDSAAAATALATGYKTDTTALSWLPASDPAYPTSRLATIAELMRSHNGASMGVVSTEPFSQATPAAFVSHNKSRYNYYDIAAEILGITRPDVVIGGGHPLFAMGGYPTATAFGSAFSTYSGASRNNATAYASLSFSQYSSLKSGASGYVFVEKETGKDAAAALRSAAAEAVATSGKLFGLFGGGALELNSTTPTGIFDPPVPSSDGSALVARPSIQDPWLADAAEAAITVLSANPNGFFLMVEQADIDLANHADDYRWMISAMTDLERAVAKAVWMVDAGINGMNWDNTSVIVTADHSNSFMRLTDAPLPGKGFLPRQLLGPQSNGRDAWYYPDGEVTYGDPALSTFTLPAKSGVGHTNELVSVYARGDAAVRIQPYEGAWYPDTGIVDNTQLFRAMCDSVGIDGSSPLQLLDTAPPVIATFILPTTYGDLTVPVTLIATDNVGVTGYCLSETDDVAACANRWLQSPPDTYAFSSPGDKTLFAFARDAAGNVSLPASAMVRVILSSPVTVSLAGSGSGRVTSDPAGISCSNAPDALCAAPFIAGSTVTLTASPDDGYLFAGWGGACTGTETCTPDLVGPVDLIATFIPDLPVRLACTSPPHYLATLREGLDAASNGCVIQLRATTFTGALSLDTGREVILSGGFDPLFSASYGMTVVQGAVTVVSGRATLDRLVIR